MKKTPFFVIVAITALIFISSGLAEVTPTPWSTSFWGSVTYNGQPAPVGTVIDAYDPDNTHCGRFYITVLGNYGFLNAYGDDPFTPEDEGAHYGESIRFKVNGREANVTSGSPFYEDQSIREVNLAATGNVAFSLVPIDNVVVGDPGTTVTVTVGVNNEGDGIDYYDVSSSSRHGWTTTDMLDTAYADPGDTALVYFDVDIPMFGPNMVDTVDFTVTSLLDNSIQADIAVIIKSLSGGSVVFTVLEAPGSDTTGDPGETIRFSFSVRNDGSDVDYYGVYTTSALSWETVDEQVVAAAVNETVEVNFDVFIPSSINGLSDTIAYKLCSQIDTTQRLEAEIVIDVNTPPSVVFTVTSWPGNQQAAPGDMVRFEIEAFNGGTSWDIYELNAVSTLGWTIVIPGPFFNDAGNTAYPYFDVIVPGGAGLETDDIDIEIFSQIDPAQIYFSSVSLSVIATGVEDNFTSLPGAFEMGQNYPNPFNPTTTFWFRLSEKSQVHLDVFNVLGQQVVTRDLGILAAGEHSFEFDGSDMASGVYFYRLQTAFGADSRKMVLLK